MVQNKPPPIGPVRKSDVFTTPIEAILISTKVVQSAVSISPYTVQIPVTTFPFIAPSRQRGRHSRARV